MRVKSLPWHLSFSLTKAPKSAEENSAVPAKTPPFKGGVRDWTFFFGSESMNIGLQTQFIDSISVLSF